MQLEGLALWLSKPDCRTGPRCEQQRASQGRTPKLDRFPHLSQALLKRRRTFKTYHRKTQSGMCASCSRQAPGGKRKKRAKLPEPPLSPPRLANPASEEEDRGQERHLPGAPSA